MTRDDIAELIRLITAYGEAEYAYGNSVMATSLEQRRAAQQARNAARDALYRAIEERES